MGEDKRILKEQFVINVCNGAWYSPPFDNYPSRDEIKAFILSLPSGYQQAQVVKQYVLVETPTFTGSPLPPLHMDKELNLTDEAEDMSRTAALSTSDALKERRIDRSTASEGGVRLQDAFRTMQMLEMKINNLCVHMKERPKAILMTEEQVKLISLAIAGHTYGEMVSYKGIPVYLRKDVKEPLICW